MASSKMFKGALSVLKMLLVYDGATTLMALRAKQTRLLPCSSFAAFIAPPVRSSKSTAVKEFTVPVLPPILPLEMLSIAHVIHIKLGTHSSG
jgi:hypothetical protein